MYTATIITLFDFLGFDLGELLNNTIKGFLSYTLGDIKGMLIGGERFMVEQYKLAFGFKDLFNATIQNTLNGIGNVTIYFSLFLITLMFIKKGVACYILWSDGDPDVSPSQLVIRFMMAIITAVSMHLLYDWVLRVAGELIGALDRVTNINMDDIGGGILDSMITNSLSQNLLFTIFSLIAVIMVIITGFKLVAEGLSLTVLKWILPITCIGLLDNDKGLFNETWKAMIRTVSTVIIQYYVLQIGIYILLNTNGGLFGMGGLLSYVLAIAVIGSTNKIANLLSQIFIPVQQGGGLMQKAYPAMMIGNMAKGLLGKR